jgi:hypothetical protein
MESVQFVKCDGGRSLSTIYPTLKPRWVRRDGVRFKLVQDCSGTVAGGLDIVPGMAGHGQTDILLERGECPVRLSDTSAIMPRRTNSGHVRKCPKCPNVREEKGRPPEKKTKPSPCGGVRVVFFRNETRRRSRSRPRSRPSISALRMFPRNRRRLIVNQVSMSAIVVVCQSFKSDLLGLSLVGVTVG